MTDKANTSPSGYYDDGAGRLRYWDGAQWTDRYWDQEPLSQLDPSVVAGKEAAARKTAAETAKAEKKVAAAAAREEKRARAAELRATKQAQKEADLAAFRQRAGNLVQKGAFGGKTVEIYENGFVRVGFVITANTPLEELRTITYRRNSRDKGSGGRALGALATGGLNLLASKEKVQAFLSIATDAKVHQLSSTQATSWEEKAGMALEAAGQSVIERRRHGAAPPEAPVSAPPTSPDLGQKSIAEQIRDLAALHADGILSDEEFSAAKANLLSQM
jgi:hypothetical protein